MKTSATIIVKQLREAGHNALFAGGCVRDLVRGVEPHDYDIATNATPAEVQRLFPKTMAVGAQFGVVLVIEGDQQFEVATFRSDATYIDGRHPTAVHFGSAEEDAQRRDFTVNGLFYDPIAEKIIDYVGGRADIERKVIRAIGDAHRRFSEDKLRLLRCVRLAANLQYDIEPATFAAVKELSPQIAVVSAERIRDELIKTFTRPHAGRGLQLLADSGLLREVLPEVAAMQGVEQPPEFHPEGDVFVHVKMMLDLLPPNPGEVLAFAVLLHDVGKPPTFERAPDRIRFNEHDRVGAEMAEIILRRLRFSNEQIDRIVVCVREHMRFQHVQQMRPSKVKRFLQWETFSDELELHRIDCLSSHKFLDNYNFMKTKAAELPPEVVKPKPLLTGHDLLALGLTPGPQVGRILAEVEELQLEERLQSREEALAYARRRLAGAADGDSPSDSNAAAGND